MYEVGQVTRSRVFASAAFFEDAAVSSCERAVRAIEATDAVEACVLHA